LDKYYIDDFLARKALMVHNLCVALPKKYVSHRRTLMFRPFVRSLGFVGVIVVIVALLTGCPDVLGSAGGSDSRQDETGQDGDESGEEANEEPRQSEDLTAYITANLAGAEALVTRSTSEGMANSIGARSIGARAAGASPLAKILADGSVADVLNFPDGMWVPDIRFVAVGPEGSVYVYFDGPLEIWNDQAGEPAFRAQMIHITPDEEVRVVEEEGWIPDFNWGWDAGRDQKPVVFDDDGGMYYVIEQNSDRNLKRYADGQTSVLTAAGNLDIQAFFTDGTSLFYLARNNTQDNNASYLKKVDRAGSITNIVYDPSGNMGIREVRRASGGLIIHGDRIPNPDNESSTYGGLLLLTETTDGYTWESVVGGENNANGGTSEIRYLHRSVFENEDGEVDENLLQAMVKRFFAGGQVPPDIDYFAEVVLDSESGLHEEFDYRQDVHFWYELLRGYEGFDNGTFDKWRSDDSWSPVFPQTFEAGIFFNELLTQNSNYVLSVDGTARRNALLDRDTINPDVVADVLLNPDEYSFAASELNGMFASISPKPGVTEIPAVVEGVQSGTMAIPSDPTIGLLERYFDFELGSRPIQSIDWQIEEDLFATVGLNDQTSRETIVVRDAYQDSVELLVEIRAALANSLSGVPGFDQSNVVWKETPEGATFDPVNDVLPSDVMNFPVEWEWESTDEVTAYPHEGPLGNYRVLESAVENEWGDSRWGPVNLVDGVPRTPNVIDGTTFNNVFTNDPTDGQIINLTYLDLGDGPSLDRLIAKLEDATNMSGLTLKESPDGETLWTLNDQPLGQDVWRPVEWEWEGDGTATYDRTGLLGNYRILNTDDYQDVNFVTNYFEAESIGYPSFWMNGWTYFENVGSESFFEIAAEYQSAQALADFFAVYAEDYGIISIAPKSHPVMGTGWSASEVASDLVYYRVVWEWEENDLLQTYDRQGPLGRYRIVSEDWDRRNFLMNLFDVETPEWTLSTDDSWNGVGYAVYRALFNTSETYYGVRLKDSYRDADGQAALTAIEDFINRHTMGATVSEDMGDRVLRWNDYLVMDDESGWEDSEATRAAIVDAFLPDLEPLPAFPDVVTENSFWEYTTGPYEEDSESYSFRNLAGFTISDTTGEIFGLFREDGESNRYDIVRVRDAENAIVQDPIVEDIVTSSLKMVGTDLFYTKNDSTGAWSLSTINMAFASPTERELIGFGHGIELYKYDVALVLNKVYFTGASTSRAGVTYTGTVDLLTESLNFNEGAVNANSQLTVYTAD